MVRLFNHWFASNMLLQVVFDAILLFLSVVLAVAVLHQGELLTLGAVVPDALLFALTMVALNSVVGLYQRNPGRTIAQTTARIALSLLLAVPVAWAIFTFLPRADAWNDTLRLAVPLAFVTFVALRGIVSHSGMSPLFVRRTLVLGTGAEAVAVEHSIGNLGQARPVTRILPGEEGGYGAPGVRQTHSHRRHGSRRRGAPLQGGRDHRRRARTPGRRAAAARTAWTAN